MSSSIAEAIGLLQAGRLAEAEAAATSLEAIAPAGRRDL